MQVLEGSDASGAPKLRPAKQPITLLHLLTHTAGFTYDTWDANTGRDAKQEGIPGVITCKNAALRTPLAFDPGARWEYGINIDWAGKAVEPCAQPRGPCRPDHPKTVVMATAACRKTLKGVALIAQRYSYHQVGLSKNTVADIVRRMRAESAGG